MSLLCFGLGFGILGDLAQGYRRFEHKWLLVGFSAAGLAAIADQEDCVFCGLVDRNKVAFGQ